MIIPLVLFGILQAKLFHTRDQYLPAGLFYYAIAPGMGLEDCRLQVPHPQPILSP